METVPPVPITLDVSLILESAQSIRDVVGSEWIAKKMKKQTSKKPPKPKNLRKFSYLHNQPAHPLVEWFLELERWRQACLQTGRLELSELVDKLSVLGKSLALVKSQKNFQKLVRRLKDFDQFESAAFEVEVAASYVKKGWKVEFIEEGTEKTPDLKIFPIDIPEFFVECKRRDSLTERDRTIAAIWKELELKLLGYMGQQRLNYLIVVKAIPDPTRDDVEHLFQLVVRAIENGGFGLVDAETKQVNTIADPSGRFELAVQKLAEPDELLETNSIGLQATEEFDRVVMGTETKIEEGGKTFFRNPKMIFLKTTILPDRVSGVVDALRTATRQLPESGPGVVWIRIPDNSWTPRRGPSIDDSFKRAGRLLQEQLTGGWNRRVNAVFVMTRVFQHLEKDGLRGLVYSPITVRIDHDNPVAPLPDESPPT